MKHIIFAVLLLTIICIICTNGSLMLPHPLVSSFHKYLDVCSKDSLACEILATNVSALCIRIANEHAQLLLHDVAHQLFQEAFFVLPPNSTVGLLIARIMGVHEFSQGDLVKVLYYHLLISFYPFLTVYDIPSAV